MDHGKSEAQSKIINAQQTHHPLDCENSASSPSLRIPRRHDLPLLDVAHVRAVEAAAYAHRASFDLMARAGEAAWNACRTRVDPADKRPWLILAGTGNNGGDAFVLARHAHAANVSIRVFATGSTNDQAADALQARSQLQAAGVPVESSSELTSVRAEDWACIIDGLLGIGVRAAPTGEAARLIACINAARHPLTIALDIPSGLNADTGHAPTPTLKARHTITFIACKPGLLTAAGPDHAGQVVVATLGLPVLAGLSGTDKQALPATHEAIAISNALTTSAWIAPSDDALLGLWPQRILDSHKGRQGDVVVVGGDSGMVGAAVLAGRAAVQMGAGRVFLGLLDGPHPPGFDPLQPELMMRTAESLSDHGGVWVLGPGAGQSAHMQTLLRQLMRHWHDTPASLPRALVLDADALNIIAADPALAVRLQSLPVLRVLTPHPLEAGRLLGRSAAAVQSDRPAAAQALARQLDAVVVLKGMGTLVADGHQIAVNLSGGPALASGGTGDVLAGTIGALLAQMDGCAPAIHTSPDQPSTTKKQTEKETAEKHLTQGAHTVDSASSAAWRAALLGTFLHGATCDALGTESHPPLLLHASQLPERMRAVLTHR